MTTNYAGPQAPGTALSGAGDRPAYRTVCNGIRVHAAEHAFLGTPARRTLCGRKLTGTLSMAAPSTDPYVDCMACERAIFAGRTTTARTAAEHRLAVQLATVDGAY